METNNNLKDFLKDVADAIRERKGTDDLINPQDFAYEIKNIQGGDYIPRWTGNADVEGLRAIGWDDEDIAYYQRYGVNWNAEDDKYHKVSQDNIDLYLKVDANNYSDYKDRIVYLPKVAISKGASTFNNFYSLVATPLLNTNGVTTFFNCFKNCTSLTCCPPLDMSSSTNFISMLEGTKSLIHIPPLNLPNADDISSMFNSSNYKGVITLNAPNARYVGNLFQQCGGISAVNLTIKSAAFDIHSFAYCGALRELHINADSVTFRSVNTFINCYSLARPYIEHLASDISFQYSPLIEKDALLYIIENALPPTGGFTIILHKSAYERLGNDEDVISATNDKNITITQAQ